MWQGGPQYPRNIEYAQGAIIADFFIIVSGLVNGLTQATPEAYSLDVSNPSATWIRLDDYPISAGVTQNGFAVVGDNVYICGGFVGAVKGPTTDLCYILDPFEAAGQQWTPFASLPNGGRGGGGMIFDSEQNALIFAGGALRIPPNDTVDFQDTWLFSLDNPGNGWVLKAPIPYASNHIGSVTAYDENGQEHHFFAGGRSLEQGAMTSKHFEYVASSNTWIQRQPLPSPGILVAASSRPFACGYITIGGQSTGGTKHSDVSYYSIATNEWNKIGDLPAVVSSPVCDIGRDTNTIYCKTGDTTSSISNVRQITL